MEFLPRPHVSGNPSIESWDSFRNAILERIRILHGQIPKSEDELSDFMETIPQIFGIGPFSYVEATKWLQNYWNIKPGS